MVDFAAHQRVALASAEVFAEMPVAFTVVADSTAAVGMADIASF